MNNITELNELTYEEAKLVWRKIGVLQKNIANIQNLIRKSDLKHKSEKSDIKQKY